MIKALLFLAFVGHIICWRCDLLLIYAPSGKFGFKCLKDNGKMSKIFAEMPLKNPLISMLLGILALMMSACGYFGLYEWMKQYSMPCAVLILISMLVFFLPGTAHHVFCGVMEWFYIRLDRTEDARRAVVEFFKKTSVTMYVCYLGQLIFSIALFAAVVTGRTSLPVWCCIFNVAPIFLLLTPFKVPGAGNIAGAAMFLGLFLCI